MKAHQMVLRHLARPKEEQRARQMARNFDHQTEARGRTKIISRRIRQWKEKDAAKACHPLAWFIETMQMKEGGFVAHQ
eukprot:scaffold10241_cov256-Chaetoceros_neogracile.AAC.25